MVKRPRNWLKIGLQAGFGPNFTMEFEAEIPKKFGLAYCTLGQPKFFWDFGLKLHGEVWAKTCLETNFQPIPKSFDHVTEAA